MSKKEAKCIRVARIECETPHDFRRMRQMAAASPTVAGARLGLLGEFLITNEARFRYLKEAYGAKEIF